MYVMVGQRHHFVLQEEQQETIRRLQAQLEAAAELREQIVELQNQNQEYRKKQVVVATFEQCHFHMIQININIYIYVFI